MTTETTTIDNEKETLSPWQKQESERKAKCFQLQQHILTTISPLVSNLNLQAEIVERDYDHTLAIFDPLNPYFKATISIYVDRSKPDASKASLHCETAYRKPWKEPPPAHMPQDYYVTHSTEYSITSNVDRTLLESLDLPYYSSALWTAFSVEFKASKAAKLILNDITPRLTKYKTLVDAAQEGITNAIAKDIAQLALANRIRTAAGYQGTLYAPQKEHTYSFDSGARVTLSAFGSIKIETPFSEQELIDWLAKQ